MTQDTTIKNPNKRINVISKEIKDEQGNVTQEGSIIMRTTRSYAAQLVANNTHTTTSKSKLRSFLNKNRKMINNSRTFQTITANVKAFQENPKTVKRPTRFIVGQTEQGCSGRSGKTYIALQVGTYLQGKQLIINKYPAKMY